MRNLCLIATCIVAVFSANNCWALQSLEKEFGANRVKITRVHTPKDINKAKADSAAATYETAQIKCKSETDRHKEYCLREAELNFRAAQRAAHDAEHRE